MSETKQDIGRFFRHSTIYVIGNALNRVGAFLLLPVYTHYLTVAEYGAMELFYAISAVVFGVLSVGLSHATLRFYFEYDEQQDRNTVVSTNLVVSAIIAMAGVALVWPWQNELAMRVFGNTEYAVGVAVILVTIIFELSSQICLAYLRATEKSMFFVAVILAKLVLQVGLNTYLVIIKGVGVVGVLSGNLATVIFGWLILVAYTIHKCGLRVDMSKSWPVLKYSFPFLLSTIVAIVASNVDRFLINALLSLEALGLYALGLKFAKLLEELVGEPFNRAYGSFRFSVMKQDNAAEIQSRITRYLVIGVLYAALGLALFTHDLLVIISDPAFWPAADYLPLLAFSSALIVIGYPLQTGILYAKKTRYIFYINMATATVQIGSSIVLIKQLGVWGACISLVLAGIVDVVMTNRLSQRFFPVKYEYGRMFGVLVIVIAAYFAGTVANQWPLYGSIPYKLGILMVVPLVLRMSGALSRDEWDHAAQWLIRLIRPLIRQTQG